MMSSHKRGVLGLFQFGMFQFCMCAALFMPSSPAHAAPLEQISCIYDAFTPHQIDFLTKQVRDRIHGAERLPDKPVREGNAWTDRAIATCVNRHGWDEIDRANANRYATSMLLMEALRRDHHVAGVNFAMLDDRVKMLRPYGEVRPIDDRDIRILAPAIDGSGLDVNNETAIQHVEVYLVTAFELFEIKADFMHRKQHKPNVDLGHKMQGGN